MYYRSGTDRSYWQHICVDDAWMFSR